MSDSSKRIKGDEILIDSEKTKMFFERRGVNVDNNFPYTSILYQDSNPELAGQRDQYEKSKIRPLLGLEKGSVVLDVGCGIGRWADELLEQISAYIGVDFSESLIEQARRRIDSFKAQFKVLSAENVCKQTIPTESQIDCVIISGVLLYLNDQQIVKCFEGIAELLSEDAVIYVREPLAVDERLTLDGFWSEELKTEYCAIYRTAEQLLRLVRAGAPRFKDLAIEFTSLYTDEKLNNRTETKQFYTLIKLA